MAAKNLTRLILAVVMAASLSGASWAGDRVDIVVRTVLASQDREFIDPALSDLARELRSVFKYSSYRLLGRDRMSLGLNESGTSSLSGGRKLRITPLRTKKGRVTLRLSIFKKNRPTFKTRVQLINNGSMTVGGPEFRGGYLLFNIFASY